MMKQIVANPFKLGYSPCGIDDVDNNRTIDSMKDSPSNSSPTPGSPTNDMSREENRLKTFDASWPHTFISPRILAKTGFYYIGSYDLVKCHFCKVEVCNWEHGDNEVDEHSKWSASCPLLKRRETSNVPLEPVSELDDLLPVLSYDVCGSYAVEDIVSDSSIVEREPQTLKHPDFPEFAIETARLRSFDDWPKTMKQRPQQLSDAGFFYTGKGDRVMCFSCAGGLRDWDEHDDPWEQHALWYGKCDYLQLVKGQEYIDEVTAKFADTHSETSNGSGSLPSSSQESVTYSCGSRSGSLASSSPIDSQLSEDDQSSDNKLCESRLCKICYTREYNTAFTPCGHVIACTKCASSVTKCPLCRKPFEHVMRLFLS